MHPHELHFKSKENGCIIRFCSCKVILQYLVTAMAETKKHLHATETPVTNIQSSSRQEKQFSRAGFSVECK